jgi:hypothetical protein
VLTDRFLFIHLGCKQLHILAEKFLSDILLVRALRKSTIGSACLDIAISLLHLFFLFVGIGDNYNETVIV